MESIGEVLKRVPTPRRTGRAASPASDACPLCGGAGYLRADVAVDDPRFGRMVPCSCTKELLEERRLRRLQERSNLGPLRGKTFENFVTDPSSRGRPAKNSPEAAHRAARIFAERGERTETQRLERPRFEWLVLLGNHGSGKTHLAAAIANYRLQQARPAIFVVVPDLLDRLRATFAPSSDVSYDELFEAARSTALLVLDDLGAQSTTSWAQEKLYQIINERYNRRLPTVISSNLSLDDMELRLRSRIGDTNLAETYVIQARDARLGVDHGASGPARAGRRQ